MRTSTLCFSNAAFVISFTIFFEMSANPVEYCSNVLQATGKVTKHLRPCSIQHIHGTLVNGKLWKVKPIKDLD